MGIVIFFILALLSAAAIVYPLLPGQRTRQAAQPITDADIDAAVRQVRRARSPAPGLAVNQCPACGHGHQTGDRFCIRCGNALPQATPARASSPGIICPNCAAALHEEDQFCAKCGHRMEPAASLEPGSNGEGV
jgi:hypothetical protein